MDSIKVGNANKRKKCQQDGIKNDFFSGLVIFNNYRMFTFLVTNSDVDYRLVEKYFPNCCWTTPIGKLARATRDRIAIKLASIYIYFYVLKSISYFLMDIYVVLDC